MAYDSDTNMEKLELTEKDLEELENMRLKTGLSDSVVELVVEEKKVVKKKKSWIGPPVPKHRDAMGRYKVPEGEKPLSLYDDPKPGPGHYDPDDLKLAKNAPAYTLGEVFVRPKKTVGPGPGKYNVGKGVEWGRCKRITIGQKNETKEPSRGPGPASYTIRRDVATGPKFSMKGRDKTRRVPGFVSKLATQLDHTVPGPSYNVAQQEWGQKPVTFGIKREATNWRKGSGPGPMEYNIRDTEVGPKWHFGTSRPKPKKEGGPGPGRYKIRSGIGQAPKAVCIPKRTPKHTWSDTPGPDCYNRAGFDLSEPGYTMKYRWFDPTPGPPGPGPATYTPHPDKPMKTSGPAYKIKLMTKPTYPSSVYAHTTVCAPGPNTYNPTNPKTTGKSFGTAAPIKLIRFGEPGPADYSTGKVLPRAPAFSICGPGRRREAVTDNPGPGSYSPRNNENKKKAGKSFGVKGKDHEDKLGPGPAAYNPCGGEPCGKCESAMGATLKSRHTPAQYSGLRDTAVLKPGRLPDIPFFGIDPSVHGI